MTKHRKRRTSTAAPRQRRRAPRRTRRPRGPLSEKKNTALLTHELVEAREQQAATSEVLRVISSSLGDLKPVFETILANATRLCGAKFGTLNLYDGDVLRIAAVFNVPPALAAIQNVPFRPHPRSGLAETIRTKRATQIDDIRAMPPYLEGDPRVVAFADLAGARTMFGVPMLKEGTLLGTIIIYRQEVRPSTDKQIELASNFANEAVIAIENTRLLNELRQRTDDLTESLEQQTATSEVLQVISSSPGELAPVFEAMLANATRICEAKFGVLWTYDGERFHAIALHGVPQAFTEFVQKPMQPVSGGTFMQLIGGEAVHQIVDIANSELYGSSPLRRAFVELGGAQTVLWVALRKDDALLGALAIYRQDIRAFSDKQIGLVKNFAAQAVIAIENTRLLNELRESLQQQTATSEVLQVISSSPGELQPVFDAMLERATRVCEANFGILFRFEHGIAGQVAMVGVPQAYIDLARRHDTRPSEHSPVMRAAKTKQVVHVVDFTSEHAYVVERNPLAVAGAEIAGIRSLVVVPMLKDDDLVGAIAIYRQEVRPFTTKQIELVTHFAAQAVIAIENTRLLSELRESLQQQTATSDVLKVISRSAFDLQAVLNTLVESAARLCE